MRRLRDHGDERIGRYVMSEVCVRSYYVPLTELAFTIFLGPQVALHRPRSAPC